jgi:hypothetical protein
MFPTVTTSGPFSRQSARQRPFVVLMQEFSELLAQTFVLLALMTEHHGALEQRVLQLLRQFAPKIRSCGAEDEEIAGGDIVDDVIRWVHAALLPLLLKRHPPAIRRTDYDATASRKYGSTF